MKFLAAQLPAPLLRLNAAELTRVLRHASKINVNASNKFRTFTFIFTILGLTTEALLERVLFDIPFSNSTSSRHCETYRIIDRNSHRRCSVK